MTSSSKSHLHSSITNEIPTLEPRSSTIDYIKRHFENFLVNQKPHGPTSPISKIKIDPTEHNWQTLNYFHWLTLFANYNVSLYNRYVAILPQINLHRIVTEDEILKYRNLNEIQRYSTEITNETELKFNFDSNKYHHVSSNMSLINQINGESSQYILNYKTALFELFGIVVFGIPTILLVVYLTILFYKCLCSKNYEQWRKSWSTSSIKRQYKIIHSKVKRPSRDEDEKYSDTDETKVHDDSDESDYYETDSHAVKSLNKYDIINQIINGQKDQIELRPLKLLNFREEFKNELNTNQQQHHHYSIDMIEIGNYLCATVDLHDQINIWSLASSSLQTNDNSNLKSIIFNESKNDIVLSIDMQSFSKPASIWSMTLTNDDR